MQPPSVTGSEHNTHLNFYSAGIPAEIANKQWEKYENHRRTLFSAEPQTQLITSHLLVLGSFATVNSVLVFTLLIVDS